MSKEELAIQPVGVAAFICPEGKARAQPWEAPRLTLCLPWPELVAGFSFAAAVLTTLRPAAVPALSIL
jgi:hypothetical protein